MKNILTTQQLREKYDPDSILKAIESSFEKNQDKLSMILSHAQSPLMRYNAHLQISLFESDQKKMTL